MILKFAAIITVHTFITNKKHIQVWKDASPYSVIFFYKQILNMLRVNCININATQKL